MPKKKRTSLRRAASRRGKATSARTKPRLSSRSKKDQERLMRELAAVFLFIFGLFTIVIMNRTAIEGGYGFKQFLIGAFGVGSYVVGFACFYVGGLILLPAKFWQKTSRILWASLIVLMLLGLLELPEALGENATFDVATTRGGILGFALNRALISVLGGFLTVVIELVTIVIAVMMLTNFSLSGIAVHFDDLRRWISPRLSEGLRSGITRLYDRIFPPKNPQPTRPSTVRINDIAPIQILGPQKEDDAEPERRAPRINNANLIVEPVPPTPITATENQADRAQQATESGVPAIWFTPPLDLLDRAKAAPESQVDPEKRARVIEETLLSFGVEARVVEINVGPTITQYALEPAVGVKVAKITNLHNDLALALATAQLRIEAPIPGKPFVGIEVPNYVTATVTLRGLLETPEYTHSKHLLPIAVGRDVSGDVFFADLTRMPHLLVAGATGSGKSVAINAVISNFLYKYNPDLLKFILVDPKVVELTRYNGIPHLLTEVITSAKKTLSALKWAVDEMERRYQILAKHGARDLAKYNSGQSAHTQLPYIVIIIDELADLMMASPVEVEETICRIAQKARAVGIHLILATQRPSVNVVTGLIKANIPTRICFAVASQMDSRVVLDSNGAEKLLGRGDMLYSSPEIGKMVRLQGVFVSDAEVERIVEFWAKQGKPTYVDEVLTQKVSLSGEHQGEDDEDELLEEALQAVVHEGRASASLLQRRLRVGYARAARLIDILESKGVVGPADGSKPREILRSSLPTANKSFQAEAPTHAFPSEKSPDTSLFDEYD